MTVVGELRPGKGRAAPRSPGRLLRRTHLPLLCALHARWSDASCPGSSLELCLTFVLALLNLQNAFYSILSFLQLRAQQVLFSLLIVGAAEAGGGET